MGPPDELRGHGLVSVHKSSHRCGRGPSALRGWFGESDTREREQHVQVQQRNVSPRRRRSSETKADTTPKVDFYDFVSHANLGSRTGQGASSWGWASPDGREFVVIAQADGAAFAEITSAGKLVYLGRLPKSQAASTSIWREIRGYKNYIVIGSEAVNHGIQIFDMSKVITAQEGLGRLYHYLLSSKLTSRN